MVLLYFHYNRELQYVKLKLCVLKFTWLEVQMQMLLVEVRIYFIIFCMLILFLVMLY